jgi:hypothetical protein
MPVLRPLANCRRVASGALGYVRLYLCDESGDPGASPELGASRLFVVCLVGYPDGGSAEKFQAADAQLRKRLTWKGEFRWSKLSQRTRDHYFDGLVDNLPRHHAIVWDKETITPQAIQPDSAAIDMMREAVGLLGYPSSGSRLIIDGVRHRDRAVAIRRALGVSEVRFESSHANPHLQLADMLAGFHAWDHAGRISDIEPRLRSLRRFRSVWR